MVKVRALEAADFGAADDMLRAAFQADGSFEPRLRRYLALQPDGWLAAEDAGQVVGTVGAIDYGAFAYIGLMAVRPDRQGQRLGRRLLNAMLALLDRRGTACAVLDASAAGAPLYERSGFADAGLSHELWSEAGAGGSRATLAALEASADAHAAVGLAAAADLDDIAGLDAELLGAPRARLWRWLFAAHPERVLRARDATGAVTGYLCLQDRLLGPFGARTPGIAAALLRQALPRLGPGRARVQVPEDNADARALLDQAGFRVVRSLRHMRRGPCAGLPAWRAVYGKASYCLG